MKKLVLFGAGQAAEIVLHYFTHDSDYEVVACTVDRDCLEKDVFHGLPVVPFDEVTSLYPPSECEMHVALSYKGLNSLRQLKYEGAKAKGYTLASYVSSKAGLTFSLTHGDNCLILESQSIQPYVRIGNNVALFGGTLIGHHSTIGDHCWITSETAIAGNVTVGQRCFIGVNATIGHMIEIGDDCFIGAGTLTTKNLPAQSVVIQRDTEIFPLKSDKFMRLTKMG